jgi:cytoskeletal protein RodZ
MRKFIISIIMLVCIFGLSACTLQIEIVITHRTQDNAEQRDENKGDTQEQGEIVGDTEPDTNENNNNAETDTDNENDTDDNNGNTKTDNTDNENESAVIPVIADE